MSQAAFEGFLEYIRHDPELQAELNDRLERANDRLAAFTLVAAKRGFRFDAVRLKAQLSTAPDSSIEPL